MATSPTLLRHPPRTLTRTCLTLKPTATTKNDRSQYRLAHFLRILKADVANSLTVWNRERGNHRCYSRVPNSHPSQAARVLVSTPNHNEGLGRGLQHHRTANPNLLLNLKAAVASKGYIQRHIGALTPKTSKKERQGRKNLAEPQRQVWSPHYPVRKQPTRLIAWQ
jgi:hypothetical protein